MTRTTPCNGASQGGTARRDGASRTEAAPAASGGAPRHAAPGIAGSADDTLEAFDVAVHFEGLAAIDGVSIAMRNGEVFGLIGPNGAARRRWSTCSPASSARPGGAWCSAART